MIKQRDFLNQTFQKDTYARNEMFQDSVRLPLKGGEHDVKHLQQSTSVLSSVGNKMPVQERENVKEKAPNQFDKEGIGSIGACFWFPKGTWQWQRYLVKS